GRVVDVRAQLSQQTRQRPLVGGCAYRGADVHQLDAAIATERSQDRGRLTRGYQEREASCRAELGQGTCGLQCGAPDARIAWINYAAVDGDVQGGHSSLSSPGHRHGPGGSVKEPRLAWVLRAQVSRWRRPVAGLVDGCHP